MANFREILEKSREINQLVEDWGCQNPRLFKGVVPKELQNLNILVDVAENGIDSVHIDALSQQLEEKLGCRVIVAAEYMLEDDYHEKILEEAIPLSQEDKLLEYYSEDWKFNLPSQNDELMPELMAQARESVREELMQNRKRKQQDVEIQETVINCGFFGAEESKRRRKNDEVLDTKKPEPSVQNVDEHLLKQVSHCRIRSK